MKLTKFEHACLDLREGSSRLVIDPGAYSTGLNDFVNITVLVITHIHQDHFDKDKVAKIIASNPKIKIFTTQEVADQLNSSQVEVPEITKDYVVGDFNLSFWGGKHAVISTSYPANQNFGVLVNQKLYYPGDSLDKCDRPHSITAVPTMAPWLKFSESADFIAADGAETVIPTHNGFINADGQNLYDRLMTSASEATNKKYRFLAPGNSIEI